MVNSDYDNGSCQKETINILMNHEHNCDNKRRSIAHRLLYARTTARNTRTQHTNYRPLVVLGRMRT